ncbi:MAG: LptF/LptG family permease [Abitibacteriaceae bacterium]|nr:LptF/LptG family permease [Abditibacteriaceae bacterium]MBV9867498.1 LptF/LptG family permease [Abditibacteriaceae bacterium]
MATASPAVSARPPHNPENQPALPTGINKPPGSVQWLRLNLCDWCYAREMLLPMSIGLIVLVLVLAGNFVYWAINSIVNHGMSILPVLRLFILASPGFSVQGIPAGVILAVCLVLNRAVRDNEIIALRVGGASIPRIIMPFLAMALAASLADWWIVEKVAPYTNDMAEKSLSQLMSRSIEPVIESDKYFRVGNYYFYVGSVENHVLYNVMIYERGSGTFTAIAPTTFPTVIIAKTAHENAKVPNQWILEDVVHHIYDDQGRLRFEAPFRTEKINVAQELSTYWADQKQPFSMTTDELSQKMNDLSHSGFDQNKIKEWRVDYYRRWSLPFACFVMALVAAPLALRFARQGSFAGLVCAFGLAFLWQGFDGWFRALGIAGYLTPFTAAWLTNGLFVLAGLGLLWRER